MEENKVVKYEAGIIKRIGNQIAVTNKLLALSEPLLIPYRKGDKWGFCTTDKKIVIDCIYDEASIFSGGLAAGFINEKNGFGFINEAGLLVIPFSFESAKEFTEGLAAVKNNDKWGYINRNGEIVIPFSFDRANRFSCGFAKITIGENEYFIDKNGDIELSAFELMYHENILANLKTIEKFRLRYMAKEEKYRTLETINDIRIQTIFASDFIKGKALVKIDNVPGIISANGEYTKLPSKVRFYFSTLIYFEEIASDGLIFFDKEGNNLKGFKEYERLGQFNEGVLDVCSKKTRRWGFVDKNGTNIIPCVYDEVDSFFKGFAKVKFHGKYGFINKAGEEYWED